MREHCLNPTRQKKGGEKEGKVGLLRTSCPKALGMHLSVTHRYKTHRGCPEWGRSWAGSLEGRGDIEGEKRAGKVGKVE